MKKLLAKTAAAVASVSILASTMMPVLADSATNDTTGAGSQNDTQVKNVNEIKVTNVSDAYIHNEVKAVSNTGNNMANKNTMGGMIQTGDAVTDVAVVNTANVNTTLVDLGRNGDGGNTAGNSITGADSQNWADILNKNKVNVKNDNTAVIANRVVAKSNTGGNMANKNTDGVGGMIQTGDADTYVGIENSANDSATSVTGLYNHGANIVGNSITGYNSQNDASIRNINEIKVKNVSDAAIWNQVRAIANSGRNMANKNTMGGMIQTGDAGVGIDLLTDANINTTSIDVGMPAFEATSGNSITGADSQNWTELVNRNVVDVVNRNNKGDSEDAPDYECPEGDKKCEFRWGVINKDEDFANTGGNMGNANTYPSSIATGIAAVGKYIRVCLNDTMTLIGAALPQS